MDQNNPDSEYKQYSTRIGAECELATESASRPTVQGGGSTHNAAEVARLHSVSWAADLDLDSRKIDFRSVYTLTD